MDFSKIKQEMGPLASRAGALMPGRLLLVVADDIALRAHAQAIEQPVGVVEIGTDLVDFQDFSVFTASGVQRFYDYAVFISGIYAQILRSICVWS